MALEDLTLVQSPTMEQLTKTCRKCRETQSIECFGLNGVYAGGRRSACKRCCASAQRKYARANKDRITAYDKQRRPLRAAKMREYGRAYYHRHRERLTAAARVKWQVDGESGRAYARLAAKKSYMKNPEKFRALARQYRVNNREKVVAHLKAYKRLRSEQFAAYERKRLARKRNSPGQHTQADVERQLIDQCGRCYWCDIQLRDYQVDHVMPLAKGRSNGPENLVIACPPCNHRKHATLPQDWVGRVTLGT